MKYRCVCGNESTSNWNNFMRGKRCQACLFKRRSGSSNYQWRIDRGKKHLDHRYRQLAYRAMKQVGMKPDGSVLRIKQHFGYTLEEFYKHVTSQQMYVKDGEWEIDHIYPVWAFTEAGILDLKIINAFDNLRIVSKEVNRKKCYKFNPVAFVNWLKSKGVAF